MDHWLANHVFTLLFLFYGQQEVESDSSKVIWVSDVQIFDTLIQRNGYSKLLMYLKEERNNRDKRIGTAPAPVGGSREGGKVSTH